MMWWNILEVAPNADQKTIKQAYAKKLKQTRPDDNPEGFQALHSAYKQGLAISSDIVYTNKTTKSDNTEFDSSQIAIIQTTENLDDQAKFENSKPINQVPQPTPEIIATHLNRILNPESTSNTYQPYYPTTDRHEINAVELNQDWQTFRQKFSLNLHQAQARESAEAWHFLEELAFFNDFEFRDSISFELFSVISLANLEALQKRTLFIKPPVLQYLNQLFHWDDQWTELTHQLGQERVDAILLHTEPTQSLKAKVLNKIPDQLIPYVHYSLRFSKVMAWFILVFLINLLSHCSLSQKF